eukprot:501935-Prymnesium_polylepis.1
MSSRRREEAASGFGSYQSLACTRFAALLIWQAPNMASVTDLRRSAAEAAASGGSSNALGSCLSRRCCSSVRRACPK